MLVQSKFNDILHEKVLIVCNEPDILYRALASYWIFNTIIWKAIGKSHFHGTILICEKKDTCHITTIVCSKLFWSNFYNLENCFQDCYFFYFYLESSKYIILWKMLVIQLNNWSSIKIAKSYMFLLGIWPTKVHRTLSNFLLLLAAGNLFNAAYIMTLDLLVSLDDLYVSISTLRHIFLLTNEINIHSKYHRACLSMHQWQCLFGST